jgi:hypothetical protein
MLGFSLRSAEGPRSKAPQAAHAQDFEKLGRTNEQSPVARAGAGSYAAERIGHIKFTGPSLNYFAYARG